MVLQLSHTTTISKSQIARRNISRGPAHRLSRVPGRTEERWTNQWTGKLPDHQLRTRPQGHLRFQDGGWANWASWVLVHGGRIILAPGSSLLSDRIILAVGWSLHWGQIQPFTYKVKAENIPRSDDPSPKMILAQGSSSFRVNGPLEVELGNSRVPLVFTPSWLDRQNKTSHPPTAARYTGLRVLGHHCYVHYWVMYMLALTNDKRLRSITKRFLPNQSSGSLKSF